MRERTQRFESRQKMLHQNYEIFHYSTPDPQEVEVHHHDFYEVYFFLGGEVSYWVEGQIYHLDPGDVLLIDPMVLHRPLILSNTTVYERIVLWIDKGYLENLGGQGDALTRCFNSESGTGTNRLHITAPLERTEMTTLLGKLVREFYSSEYGASLCADGLLTQFLVELNRLAFSSSDPQSYDNEKTTLTARVLDFVNENYSENLSLDSLAQHFFVSKYHLSHEFSRTVGMGVYRYIMLKRLTAAKQMLSENISPGEVCVRCGFKDYTSFFRAFKAEFGVSPGAFSTIR